MQEVFTHAGEDPYPPMLDVLTTQTNFLKNVGMLDSWIDNNVHDTKAADESDNVEKLKVLYEQAWTVYSRDTFDHSVKLIVDRLKANGFDENYFAGKTCFDGGCGTARFAVAMAQLGAEKVVAADFGEESLTFAEDMLRDLGIDNVELVNMDVTDLSRFEDGAFDFVVSNGVLHHTVEQERGIREHFRVTKKGGVFWLYLYGVGGIFWEVYDAFKEMTSDIDATEIRRIMVDIGIREGGIYSFLDMLAQIRVYYTPNDIERILKDSGEFAMSNMKGTSVIDDTDKLLNTKYGADIRGPNGEVRLRIDKQ